MIVKNVVVGQKYTDRQGVEKTKWTTIGAAFIKDDGKIGIKIEQIPLNWDGHCQLFDRESRTQGQYAPQQPATPQNNYDDPTARGRQPQQPPAPYQPPVAPPPPNRQPEFPTQGADEEVIPFQQMRAL